MTSLPSVVSSIFIVGCGYVGRRLLPHLNAEVTVLSHTPAHHADLRALGAHVIDADLDSTMPLLPVQGALLYYFAPPPSRGVTDPRMQNCLRTLDGLPAKIVLISTSGVYGDCGGAWIDEKRPPAPQVDRARRRLHAEESMQHWCIARDVPYAIIRVPGIYGPQRLPVARLRQALPVLAEAESPYSNRIHVDDLVRVCLAAAALSKNGIFHVSDGHPSSMTDYFMRVAAALNIPAPPRVTWAQAMQHLSREMLDYLAESKRLDISKMVQILGVTPHYPDLNSGLAQCVAEEASGESCVLP
jgi:nucleoside-diphosphate-sugar epimerase